MSSTSGTIRGDQAGLILLKQDETGKPLAGASFRFTAKNLVTRNIERNEVISVSNNGQVTITGLRYGTSNDISTTSGYEYTLTEETAPTGYQLSREKWVIQVGALNVANPELTKFWINGVEATSVSAYEKTPYVELEVKNLPVVLSASLKLSAQKTVNGNTPAAGEVFSFTLVEMNAAGEVLSGGYTETVQNNGSSISFSQINYTGADVGKIHYYEITENATSLVGYTTDTVRYWVEVKVVKEAADKLTVTNTITKNSGTTPIVGEMVFANSREKQEEKLFGSLTISKTVIGSGGDTSKDFTFKVSFDKDGSFNYIGSKTGTIRSGDSITLRHGQSITILELPVGVNYTVTEVEANLDGYTTTSTGAKGKTIDGTVTASFTNSKPNTMPTDPPTKPKYPNLPRTGDSSSPFLWLTILALSGLGLFGLGYFYKRKDRK